MFPIQPGSLSFSIEAFIEFAFDNGHQYGWLGLQIYYSHVKLITFLLQ